MKTIPELEQENADLRRMIEKLKDRLEAALAAVAIQHQTHIAASSK